MQREEIEQFKQLSQELSILMVDDEVALTENYLAIAQRFFKHVEIANSAEKVIECFEKNRFHSLLSHLASHDPKPALLTLSAFSTTSAMVLGAELRHHTPDVLAAFLSACFGVIGYVTSVILYATVTQLAQCCCGPSFFQQQPRPQTDIPLENITTEPSQEEGEQSLLGHAV